MKKLGPVDYHRMIVGAFCEFQGGLYGEKLNEAVKVFKEFPDKSFWDWMFLNCKLKVESPSWFLTDEGKIFLQGKKRLMFCDLQPPKKEVELEDSKIGQDLKINKKRTLLDFIRDGKSKKK